MNNQRRKRLSALLAKVEEAWTELDDVIDLEQEVQDNTPDNLKSSDRAAEAQEVLDTMTNALESLETAIDHLREINGVM